MSDSGCGIEPCEEGDVIPNTADTGLGKKQERAMVIATDLSIHVHVYMPTRRTCAIYARIKDHNVVIQYLF